MGNKHRWGVIIDAGSSGSRLHVYHWKDPANARLDASRRELHSLPAIKTSWTRKIRPGISTLAESPARVGPDHLKELIDYALEIVPPGRAADTPIFLMATAGMRLLPRPQQTALLRETCDYLRRHTPFALPDCAQYIQVIPGETEGLYGWLAANFLLGGFDPERHSHSSPSSHTFGFLDMGGASAQIAFAPNATEAAAHADQLQLVRLRTLDGRPSEHRVFAASWLGFGVHQARASYVRALVEASPDRVLRGGEIPDPCLPRGLRTRLDGGVVKAARRGTGARARAATPTPPTLVGTGDFAACLAATQPLLALHDAACRSDTHACLIHGPVPSIDYSVNHFVGVSEYYHATHGFFAAAADKHGKGKGHQGKGKGKDKDKDDDGEAVYDYATYERNVLTYCSQDWTSIYAKIEGEGAVADSRAAEPRLSKDPARALQDAQQACFKASWVINVLHEGIGIPRSIAGSEDGVDMVSGIVFNATDGPTHAVTALPFRPIDTVKDVEVSWALGRILLYAAGQVPPLDSGEARAAAVGFGSNTLDGSIPPDFTYAGSTWAPVKFGGGPGQADANHGLEAGGDDDDDGASGWTDAAGDLLDAARESSGLPGAVIFVLLLVLFAFVLRKRERRVRLASRLGMCGRRSRGTGNSSISSSIGSGIGSGASSPRKTGRFAGPLAGFAGVARLLFRRPGHHHYYERVLEEGRTGGSSFELADVNGVDALDNDDLTSDGSDGGSGSVPLASAAMDRSGLVVRTESRERLGIGSLGKLHATGRRSRAASPTRLKSPLMMPLQDD